MKQTIETDRLIARVMRLSRGDMLAEWTAAGIVKVIEEEATEDIVSPVSLTSKESVIEW